MLKLIILVMVIVNLLTFIVSTNYIQGEEFRTEACDVLINGRPYKYPLTLNLISKSTINQDYEGNTTLMREYCLTR